jgi:hypothetical protein
MANDPKLAAADPALAAYARMLGLEAAN